MQFYLFSGARICWICSSIVFVLYPCSLCLKAKWGHIIQPLHSHFWHVGCCHSHIILSPAGWLVILYFFWDRGCGAHHLFPKWEKPCSNSKRSWWASRGRIPNPWWRKCRIKSIDTCFMNDGSLALRLWFVDVRRGKPPTELYPYFSLYIKFWMQRLKVKTEKTYLGMIILADGILMHACVYSSWRSSVILSNISCGNVLL